MQRHDRFVAIALSLGLFFVIWACTADKAKTIVDSAIETHGGDAFRSFQLSFDFRDRHYTASRNNGVFRYTRTFTDSTGHIRDVLDNNGLRRFRNDTLVNLPPDRSTAFTNSVNSVIYFALLPFGLNDKPVRKEWLGERVIGDEPYDMIRVTFDTGQSDDIHDDIYLYWFHRDRKTMDYLAYSYKTEGGGIRFRRAVNSQPVGGILLQDYENFRPSSDTISLERLPDLFLSGELMKVSDIHLENVSVTEYRRTLGE